MSNERIIETIQNENITVVFLLFVDENGLLKCKAIPGKELSRCMHLSLENGIAINGSLLGNQTTRWAKLIPDKKTFRIMPFLISNRKACTLFCDLIQEDRVNPRKRLLDLEKEYLSSGMKAMTGLGLIFGLGKEQFDISDAYNMIPEDKNTYFLLELVDRLEQLGIDTEGFVSYGHGWYGIEFVPQTICDAVDHLMIAKWICQSLAYEKDVSVLFNKPVDNINPMHLSVWKIEELRNLFYDEEGVFECSSLCFNFAAGILEYLDKEYYFGNNGNPYYDKVIDTEAKKGIVSIANYFVEKKKVDRVGWSKRLIFHGCVPDANYYQSLCDIYSAGLKGIRENLSITTNQLLK